MDNTVAVAACWPRFCSSSCFRGFPYTSAVSIARPRSSAFVLHKVERAIANLEKSSDSFYSNAFAANSRRDSPDVPANEITVLLIEATARATARQP